MATMAASESSFSSETESSSKGGSGKSQVSGKDFSFWVNRLKLDQNVFKYIEIIEWIHNFRNYDPQNWICIVLALKETKKASEVVVNFHNFVILWNNENYKI